MGSRIVSIKLDEEMYKKLSEISKKKSISRSALIRRAISSYLAQPEVEMEDIKEISLKLRELEKKYYEALNRINLLSRQIEKVMSKEKVR